MSCTKPLIIASIIFLILGELAGIFGEEIFDDDDDDERVELIEIVTGI